MEGPASHTNSDVTTISSVCLQSACNDIIATFTSQLHGSSPDMTIVNDVLIRGISVESVAIASFLPPTVMLFHGLFSVVGAAQFERAFQCLCAACSVPEKVFRVTIVLNSNGGEVTAMERMVGCLNAQRKLYPLMVIEMVACDSICSCGFVFFMQGDVLYHSASTRFLQHQPYSVLPEGPKVVNNDTSMLEHRSIKQVKDLTYDIAETGLFDRRLKYMDGFIAQQPGENKSVYEKFTSQLRLHLQTTFHDNEATEKAFTDKRKADFDSLPTKSHMHDRVPAAVETVDIDDGKKKLAADRLLLLNTLRARWYSVYQTALDEAFPRTKVCDNVKEQNVFATVTSTYGKDENTLFLTNNEMKKLGLMEGVIDRVNIYKMTTTVTREVLLDDDTHVVRVA